MDSDLACGWFSGILNRNALQLGTNGNGNTNQIGIANGNIVNGQLNVPDPQPRHRRRQRDQRRPDTRRPRDRWCGDQCRRRRGCTDRRRGARPQPGNRRLGSRRLESRCGAGRFGTRRLGNRRSLPVSTGGVAIPVAAGVQTALGERPANGWWRHDESHRRYQHGRTPRQPAAKATAATRTTIKKPATARAETRNSNQNITRGGNATSCGSATSGTANGGAASGGSASSGANANAGGNQSNNTSTNNTSSGNGNNSSNSTG